MVKLEAGKYIVAISGGVDSVVLLNMLSKEQNLTLVVAHFNHGIRLDSVADEQFVSALASQYGYKVEVGYGKLGPKASEATARTARYKFLNEVKTKYGAKSIITAHHQDDVIETAIINLLRGTSRRGVGSLKSTKSITRPLLGISKQDIYGYAQTNKLNWVEDKSNNNPKYLRNWVRLNIMPKLKPGSDARMRFLQLISTSQSTNKEIDNYIATMSHSIEKNKNNRGEFILLPNAVASEVAHGILTRHSAKNVNKKSIAGVVNFIKTAHPGSIYTIDKKLKLSVGKNNFKIG